MTCRVNSRRSAALSERSVRVPVEPARQLEPTVERPPAADPCGEDLLDEDTR